VLEHALIDPPRVDAIRPGALTQRIVQIHPTLRCNLTCRHCYSTSGPREQSRLDPLPLCDALADAAAIGYEAVGVAGGEPLMYDGLDEVLAHARSCGLRTAVTTNGTLLTRQRLARLVPHLNLVAVSIDGPPALHNQMRGSATAFARVVSALELLRESGVPFGIILTITDASWQHLDWVADFAVEHGASLLQLHPLELTGRAKLQMIGQQPRDEVMARVYLMTLVLASRYREQLSVQLDVFNWDYFASHRDLLYASALPGDALTRLPADLLNLLVIEADGAVVPISYGFSRQYAVGNITQQRLTEAWASFVQDGYARFRDLCRRLFQELEKEPRELPFFNWYELIVSRSHGEKYSAGDAVSL
jgi:MoaA/NifB/PqqE/SkfB family radical SAM enzyme